MAVIWPSMVAVLFTTDGGASMYAGWLSSVPSCAIVFGQVVSGLAAEPIGKTKYQVITVLTIGGATLGGESFPQFLLESLRPDTPHSGCRGHSRHQRHGDGFNFRFLFLHWLE
jgi:MFS family permease